MSLQYVVQWVQIANGVKKNVTVRASPHTIEGLNALTNYTVCVATEYQEVATECSDEVFVQTLRGNSLGTVYIQHCFCIETVKPTHTITLS